MCKYFSCIVTRDLKILWEPGTNSHEEIIKKHGLKDDKLEDRDFVRIELTPNGDAEKSGIFTRERKDWEHKVDEKGTLPAWYTQNASKAEELVWKAALKSLKPLDGLVYLANVTQEEAKAAAKERGGEILLNSEIDVFTQKGVPNIGWIWTGTHVKYKGTDCTVTERGKSAQIKLPERCGWYTQDKFGIPSGEPISSDNVAARYLSRISENDGLLVRWYLGLGDDLRRVVLADYRPYCRFGVLIRVPPSAAKADKKTKKR